MSEVADMRGRIPPAVKWLLAANVGVHFLQLVLFGAENTMDALAFDSASMPSRWWTLLTYMFVHAGLVHLALNMFVLWSFGPRLEEAWGTRAFLTFYVWCGLGGVLTHMLVIRTGTLVGASAAIYGLMLAYGSIWKDDEVFLFGVVPVRARWLVLWLVAVNIVYAFIALEGATSIAAFAHLGGLVFGWLYLKGPAGVGLSRVRDRIESVPDDTGDMPRVVPKHQRRAREKMSAADEVIARSKAVAERTLALTPRRSPDLDAVLDKISRSGLGSLTPEERHVLEQKSKELRKR